jgi:peptide/nickel transport system permease protein
VTGVPLERSPLDLVRVEPVPRHRLRAFARHRLAVVGVIGVIAMTGFCFLGPLVYDTDQVHTNLREANLEPGAGHPLGTDSVGHDVLGRLMVGGQSSILVGLGAAAIAIVLGVAWGAVSGYVGGWVDSFMMRIVDALLALPGLLILMLLATIFRPSVPMLIVVLGLGSWLGPARFVRGETLSLREREYVQAVRLMGGGPIRALYRHIVPNTFGTILVNATFQVADAILAIAALSFLGLGIPPPAATWGGMLTDGLSYSLAGYWWLIYPPGICIVIVVIAFNFIGDGLRDVVDVRLLEQ